MRQLLSEIQEQPLVLQRLIEEEYPLIQDIAQEIRARDVRFVLVAARGSSDNAATFAKYLFGVLNGLPVALAAPSLYTIYERPPLLQDCLVLAISQSGMPPDIVSVVQDARNQGMLTVAVVNAPESRLAQAAERVISCRAGVEHSVAATKSFTAELVAIAMLSVALTGDHHRLDELRALPDAVARTLALGADIPRYAERYRYMTDCVVIGRGYNYATAFEIALKLKELTYSGANPYSSADFYHGPIAVVTSGFPVFVVAPSGQVLPELCQLAKEVNQREAEPIIVSDQEQVLDLAQTPLRLAVGVAEWLSPVTAVVPGQLFAYHLALAKGLDPQKPRGLCKITKTR